MIDKLNKAIQGAEEEAFALLKKSQMSLDFTAPAHDHHVAYTRTTASGATIQIKAKGTAAVKHAQYEKGKAASAAGKPHTANPWPDETPENIGWHHGWDDHHGGVNTPNPYTPAKKTDMETAQDVAKTVVAALKEHGLDQAGVYIIEYPDHPGHKPEIQITTGEDKYEPTKEGEDFTRWWSANSRKIKQETGIEVGLAASIGMDSKGVTTVKEPRHYADHIRDTTQSQTVSSRGLDAMHGRGTGNGGSGTAWR
jgi:hypothetical protein